MEDRKCKCGASLEGKKDTAKYCSYKCLDRDRYYKNREKRLLKDKRYFETHKKEHAARSTLYRKRNREKYRARYLVMNALRKGLLKRSLCEVCGEQKSHGHHDDYSKPLVVRWLCVTHHFEIHRKYGSKV